MQRKIAIREEVLAREALKAFKKTDTYKERKYAKAKAARLDGS